MYELKGIDYAVVTLVAIAIVFFTLTIIINIAQLCKWYTVNWALLN